MAAPVFNLLLRLPLSPSSSSLLPTFTAASSSGSPPFTSSGQIRPGAPKLGWHPRRCGGCSARAAASPSSATSGNVGGQGTIRLQRVHNVREFEAALRAAKNKLVVVEYARSDNQQSQKIYPVMVDLSRRCGDVDFILVMGDESEETRELCRREGVDKVPHFSFYKGMERLHDEEGIGPDQLMGDVLYYGDNHSLVEQLHSRWEVEELVAKCKEEGKMLVLDVGLKHCGPCVKVYPAVIKLSKTMADLAVVFARMNGDENDSCMQYLRDMDVVEVPTFLFFREGKLSGRYVGSGKGELVGEILRYQGVPIV